MPKALNLTDQKFERLVAKEDSGRRDKSGHVIWECLCDCGNICFIPAGDLTSGHSKSCGCYHKECVSKPTSIETRTKMSIAHLGAKAPGWKGGVSSENHLERHRLDYKIWRKAVFERDDHTCQKCGNRGGKLNAHHVEGFDNNPKLRTEINNGATLCEDCHMDFHHQYNKGNNTKKQWDRFLDS